MTLLHLLAALFGEGHGPKAVRIGAVSKLEFYLAPLGLSRIANPSVLLRLELFNGGLTAVWHFLKVYMEKKRQRGKLGHAAHTCILFGKSRSPKVGNEKACHSLAFPKLLRPQGG